MAGEPLPLFKIPSIHFKRMGGRGFEPPWVSPTAPKAVASTSSAIRPFLVVSGKC